MSEQATNSEEVNSEDSAIEATGAGSESQFDSTTAQSETAAASESPPDNTATSAATSEASSERTNEETKREMTSKVECPRFEFGSDTATIGSRWEKWIWLWQNYLVANDLDDMEQDKTKYKGVLEKQNRAKFMLLIGEQAVEVYLTECKDSDTLLEVIKKMTKYFKPTKNVIAEQTKFMRMSRYEDECVNAYMLRLRMAASHCDFGNGLDSELRRQFISGCRMPEMDQKGAKAVDDSELTLEKIVKFALAVQSTSANVKAIRGPSDADARGGGIINHLASTSQRSSAQRSSAQRSSGPKPNTRAATDAARKPSRSCDYCGWEKGHREINDCPARGKQCASCGKMGHYAKVCRSSKSSNHSAQRSSESGREWQKRGDSENRSGRQINTFSQASGSASSKHGACQAELARKLESLNEEECADITRLISSMRMNLNQIGNSNEGPRARVKVGDVEMDFLIDTGAPVNVLDEAAFAKLTPKPKLEVCKTKFFAHQAKVPLDIAGMFSTDVSVGDRTLKAAFIVVRGQHGCLLSYRTALQLELIAILNNLTRKVLRETGAEPSIEQMKEMFPKLFSGKLGCMKDVEVKLDVDESVKPVKQQQRPIAFHMRDTVAKELRSQVDDGILEPIGPNDGPTPWVSNLVVVPKEKEVRKPGSCKTRASRPVKNGQAEQEYELAVRLTVDNRALNKAIRRTRFPGRSIDDLAYEVNGATIFSTLDFRKAFHQMELAEESRNLTAVTTHLGLFRYKRLHMGISCASEIFSEHIRKLLADIPGQINMTDDILVFGKTREEHHKSLMAVLTRLEENGVTLNLSKCQL